MNFEKTACFVNENKKESILFKGFSIVHFVENKKIRKILSSDHGQVVSWYLTQQQPYQGVTTSYAVN